MISKFQSTSRASGSIRLSKDKRFLTFEISVEQDIQTNKSGREVANSESLGETITSISNIKELTLWMAIYPTDRGSFRVLAEEVSYLESVR